MPTRWNTSSGTFQLSDTINLFLTSIVVMLIKHAADYSKSHTLRDRGYPPHALLLINVYLFKLVLPFQTVKVLSSHMESQTRSYVRRKPFKTCASKPDTQQPSISFAETLGFFFFFLENKLLLFIYMTFNTNLLHNNFTCYIFAPTCFDLTCWSSSGSSKVFRRLQLMRQLMWQRFDTHDYKL